MRAEAFIVKAGVASSTEPSILFFDEDAMNSSDLDFRDGNYSMNYNNSWLSLDSSEDDNFVPHILKSIVLVLIIVLAIFSNLLVVISVVRYHKLRHINNYFLVSLAVADLLVACFAMTFNATVEITGQWNFGYRICDLWNSLDVHFSTVSTLHLCCIAMDRYFAIVRPLKYTTYMTVKVAGLMIGVAWTAPTLISFLPIFLGWYTTEEHQKWRESHPNECILRVNQPYAFISSTLTFWAPVIVMLVMYRRIYKEALRQKEAIRRSSVPSQQHLIVDSDSVRSRFQVLQANGFRSAGNSTKKPLHPIKAPLLAPAAPPPPTIAPPIIMTSSASASEGLKATEQCETKFNGTAEGKVKEPGPTAPAATPMGPAPPLIGSVKEQHPATSSATSSPVRNALTPTAALLGTVQRRLSIANSNLSEEITPFNLMTEAYPGATSVMGVWTLGLGLLGDNSTSAAAAGPEPGQTGPRLSVQWNSELVESAAEYNSDSDCSDSEGTPSATAQLKSLVRRVTQQPALTSLPSFSEIQQYQPRLKRRLSSIWLRERHRIHTSWRKEHKAFVTLGIVMGAFLICWLPFFTWYLTVTICGDTYCPCPDVVVSILFWIGYFNSTLNPLIYVMTNRDFKDAFTDILRRIFCFCCPNKGCSCCCEASNGGPDAMANSNLDYV